MRVAVADRDFGATDPGVLAAEAAALGAELLVLPEAEPGVAAEPSDGPWACAVAARARSLGMAIAAGYREACVTGLYNSALLVDRAGICLASYRQTHVAATAPSAPSRGNWLTTMPLEGRRLGLMVGHDIDFPEVGLALALAGVDTLVVLGGVSDGESGPILPARARDAACWLAYAGRGARIIDPSGRLVAGAALAGGLVVADLGASAVGQERRGDRRPRLYRILVDGTEDESRPA